MLQSLNTNVSLSETEKCMIVAGLFGLKQKQTDDYYKEAISQLIEKIVKV